MTHIIEASASTDVDIHKKIELLASKILYHKKLYYKGASLLSDPAYDALEDELRALCPDHPVLHMVGYPLGENEAKIPHAPPMLSLAKTYSISELHSFIVQYGDVVCMDKFDGMALCLEYAANGTLVRASTRGDGHWGEDVTEFVYHIPSIPKHLTWSNFVSSFDSTEHSTIVLEVRGEVYFPRSAFADFEDMFDSYRNAVPGTFARKNVEEAIPVLQVLGFCAYDVIIHNIKITFTTFLEKIEFLEKLNFYTGFKEGRLILLPPAMYTTQESLETWVQAKFAEERNYLIDGLVFRLNNEALWQSLGATSHHPRGSLAFKQTGETAITEILDIEYNVGRSGKIAFRAKLQPVTLSGARISFATLHNAEFIEAGRYAPKAHVRIKRSGEVIPAIIECVTPAPQPYVLPSVCLCQKPLERRGPDLWCVNPNCPYKDQESLVHFVNELDVPGINEKIILRLRTAGLIKTPVDLFDIRIEDLLQLDGFAQKSAENFVNAVAQRRRVKLWQFLVALGLARGGITKCKEVAKIYKKLDTIRKLTVTELAQNKGWGEKSARDFLESLQQKASLIDTLLQKMEIEEEISLQQSLEQKSHPLAHKNICITGALSHPREHYRNLIEKVGAKLVDSVSSKTHFLVCNEASNSQKYQKAQSLGIPIINEQEFLNMLESSHEL